MNLIKKYVGDPYENHIEFEAISGETLMITVNKACPSSKGVPSYWRLTGHNNTTIPPLEIGIHFIEQTIDNITFFVSKGMIVTYPSMELKTIIGSVLPDISIFTRQYEFVDVGKTYNISLCNEKLIVFWGNIDNSCTAYRNERMEFYVDNSDCIVGFAILKLTKKEIELLDKYI